MTNKVYHPYHFAPVKGTAANPGHAGIPIADMVARTLPHITHSCYCPDTHSGRLISSVETMTPVVVGNERIEVDEDKKLPAQVRPFRLDGLPALPASSLRGLISSLAETVSNSACRVLDDTPLGASRRSVHQLFRQVDGESSDLLPYGAGRQHLTPAELLFGFVARQVPDDDSFPVAFAGRCRFSFGRLVDPGGKKAPYFLRETPLKTLLGPNPEALRYYFTPKEASTAVSAIPKNTLDPEKHRPQGRKFYLHHRVKKGTQPWAAGDDMVRKNPKIHTVAKPMRAGLRFVFHIEFDNLTDDELGLLCYALTPSTGFHHKLGMGKSLGLGSVRIDPVGLFLVDRARRYTAEGFQGPRYSRIWIESGTQLDAWPAIYAQESEAVRTKASAKAPDPKQLSWQYAESSIDPDIRKALECIGEMTEPQYPVEFSLPPKESQIALQPMHRNSRGVPPLEQDGQPLGK